MADLTVRELTTHDDLLTAQALDKTIWQTEDLDVTPAVWLAAAREIGAILLGAFDGGRMVAINYGFPGLEHGRMILHSHVLGVLADYRDRGAGRLLKLEQRRRAREAGFPAITWTYDPLQSRNAFFNLHRLGATAPAYRVNFYGEASSSPLHAGGTDRLWIEWDTQREREPRFVTAPEIERLVSCVDGSPVRGPESLLGESTVLIAIPPSIDAIRSASLDAAFEWRLAVRWAFTSAMETGFRVADFDQGCYVLRKPV